MAQQERWLDLAHFEQRHHRKQQRYEHPHAGPLGGGRPRQPVIHRQRADLIHVVGNHRDRNPRHQHADKAANNAQRQRLEEIDAENLTARATDALHDRDALDLLPHEHARHARHRDAAEHDNHETDQAEIIFGALEVFADLFLTISKGAHTYELRPQLGLQIVCERVDLSIGNAQQHLARDAAAERDQAVSARSS